MRSKILDLVVYGAILSLPFIINWEYAPWIVVGLVIFISGYNKITT